MDRFQGTAALAAIALVLAACHGTPRAELGNNLYDEYCASCHGTVTEEGAVSTTRATEAPDLTRLAERLGQPLPRETLASYIDGRRELSAHGTREMPVWGTRLYEDYPQTPGTEAVREGTVALIIDYLETIQAK